MPTLLAVAKDVKLQVEFNPERVKAYRLIGYDNRRMKDEEFRDDKKDAGEMGAGHSVTALYEIVPAGASEAELDSPPLQYQRRSVTARRRAVSSEILTVWLRYKQPSAENATEFEPALEDRVLEPGRTSGLRWRCRSSGCCCAGQSGWRTRVLTASGGTRLIG